MQGTKETRGIGGSRSLRRGSALLAATLALMVLLGLGGVILRASTAGRREQRAAEEVLRAAYLAESGVHDGIANLIAGATNDIGSANQPAAFGGGSYWVDVVDNLDGTFELTSRASDGRQRMAVQAVVRPPVDDPLPGAVFAGNSSGDPLYALEFSGTAPRNDEITGAVYSGADVSIQDDATVNGAITAGGAIYGGAGQSGTTKPSPDIAGMQYDTNHDVDVASDFASAAQLACDAATLAFIDPARPAPRFFYLVRAENGCVEGLGPLGARSDGASTCGRSCP